MGRLGGASLCFCTTLVLCVCVLVDVEGHPREHRSPWDEGYDDVKMEAEELKQLLSEDIARLEVGGAAIDESVLGSFARHCKMDLTCAVRTAKNYIHYRSQHPDVFSNLTIPNEHMINMLNDGIRLLDGMSCSGHKVAIAQNRRMHWDGTMLEVLQMQVYNHERLFRRQDAQKHGIVIVQDMVGFRMSHIWKTIRSGGIHLTNIYPQNIAKVVITGEPRFFGLVWNAIKQILPPLLRDAVVMNGHNWDKLAEVASGGVCEGAVFEALKEFARRHKDGESDKAHLHVHDGHVHDHGHGHEHVHAEL